VLGVFDSRCRPFIVRFFSLHGRVDQKSESIIPASSVSRSATHKQNAAETVVTLRRHPQQLPKRKTCGRDGYPIFPKESKLLFLFLFNLVRFTWAMIFEMLSRVYGVPKQVGVEVKKIFLILAEKNKMRSPQTLPHGGGGSIRGWRKQPGENFFYCLCFLCLFHWLPWMRKLLLCRYIHTRVDIDCAGRRAKPIAHSNIYGRTTRVTQSSKNCGECSTPWLWKLYTYTHTHAQVVVAVVG
jgi:hypothetical protein